jgi:hypothetical protein
LENPERRFRLRRKEKIVGYMRKVSKSLVLYSTDGFWWKGAPIDYSDLDEFTGLKDQNNQYIYEWDILNFKLDPDSEYRSGVILWEGRQKVFGIKDLEDGHFIPLFLSGVAMFNPRQLKIFSYLFLNPDLKLKLGVKD